MDEKEFTVVGCPYGFKFSKALKILDEQGNTVALNQPLCLNCESNSTGIQLVDGALCPAIIACSAAFTQKRNHPFQIEEGGT